MTKCLKAFASAAALATALGSPVDAQEAPKPPAPPVKPVVALKLQVVVSRYQGEKKISSLPYTLSVNNDRTLSTLRMGSKVPVLSVTRPDDKNSASFTYQDVGMNINSQAVSTDDGRFRVEITIQDTSVYSEAKTDLQGEAPTLKDIPTFRTFTSSQTLILKDGQTTQFTTATDRVSGEVTKVDVTLTVVK